MAKTEMKKDREAKGIFKDTAKSDTIKRDEKEETNALRTSIGCHIPFSS